VVAGLRQAGADEAQTTRWCDEMVTGGSLEALYGQVEALHVLTSLSGFEALLRGVEVHTWGLPFYAGWGLTHDRHACPRRGRKLELDELAFGALVAYPSYVSRFSGLFITAEQAIEELLAWRREPPLPLSLRRRIFRKWGRLREWFALDF
jgi:capsular polysaccharide export protein